MHGQNHIKIAEVLKCMPEAYDVRQKISHSFFFSPGDIDKKISYVYTTF